MRCAVCGAIIPETKRGRRRKYCEKKTRRPCARLAATLTAYRSLTKRIINETKLYDRDKVAWKIKTLASSVVVQTWEE